MLVEGDGENILLPELAKLLGRPLENYGVSIVKCDNSGSWKRFARLFLRSGQDENQTAWHPTKVCVLRDLDLWPDCAEEKDDGSNPYGFRKENSRNQAYWRRNCPDDRKRKIEHIAQLDRQNVAVKISDDWTFEYCLAKYGLFGECYEAIVGSNTGIDDIVGDDDTKATFILSQVSKTDFAYELSRILQKQQEQKVDSAIASLSDADASNNDISNSVQTRAKTEFAVELRQKLPNYLIEAIEYVTEPIEEEPEEVRHAALT